MPSKPGTDVHPRRAGALGEQVGVAQQQVVGTDLDVGGRQAMEVGPTGESSGSFGLAAPR